MKYLLLFLLCVAQIASAQTSKVTLTGRLTESRSNNPLPFAILQISNKSSDFQCATNEKGRFELPGLDTGSYTIRVSYLGCFPLYTEVHLLKPVEEMELSMDSQERRLKGTEVVASQPYITIQKDKFILNIDQSPLGAANNVYETIKRAPGVTDAQGLMLRGKMVSIYINGRPLRLSGSELENYLTAIPTSTISSLEMIANPSARYEAKDAAVINIVMARDKNLGTNGSLNLGAGMGNHFLYNGGISLHHKTKKLDVYGSYDYLNNTTDASNTTTRYLGSNQVIQEIQGVSNDLQGHIYKLGFDHTLSARHSWGVLLRGSYNIRNLEMDNTSATGNGYSVLNRSNASAYHTPSANLYFRSLVGKQKNELLWNLDYFRYDKSWTNDLLLHYFNNKNESAADPQSIRSSSPAHNNVWSLSGDYSFSLNTYKIATGLKSILTRTDNDLLWENLIANTWTKDNQLSNHFIYQENVHAAYVDITHTYGKFDFQGGLRGELTTNNGNSVTLQKSTRHQYFSLFPSLSVTLNPNREQRYELSYRRKIERFGFDIVNPFTVYLGQYLYSQGNPDIRPSFSDNLELSWSFRGAWMANVSYGRFHDVLAEVYKKEQNGDVTIGTFDNVRSADQWMAGLSYNKGWLQDWIYSITSLNALYAKYHAEAASNLDNSSIGVMFNNSTTFKLGKTWKTELSAGYSSPLRFGAYDFNSQFRMNIGISKSLMDNKGILTLNVSDIFNTYKRNYTIVSYDVMAVTRNNPETRFVKLSFNYRFGNQEIKAARNRRISTDEVKQRMKE